MAKRTMLVLSLFMSIALLQAGGKKNEDILSYDGSSIYQDYVSLTDKALAKAPWLDGFLEKNGVSLEDARSFFLQLEENPPAEMSEWQQKFVSNMVKQAKQINLAYQKLVDRASGLSDENEKIYLTVLLRYGILNTTQGTNPDSPGEKAALDMLIDMLKPVIDKKKYHLSDAYRLYAELLNRVMPYRQNEIIQLSADSKRHAEEAIKLDGKNGMAHIALASWFIYAPKSTGGDDEYALKLLKQARSLGVGSMDELMSWNLSAVAYDHLRQPEMVKQSLDQALTISPFFQWTLEFRKRANNNQPLDDFYYE